MAYRGVKASKDLRIFTRKGKLAYDSGITIPANHEFLVADETKETVFLKSSNRAQTFLPVLWKDAKNPTVVGFVKFEDYQAAEIVNS